MIISVDFDGTLCRPNCYPEIRYDWDHLHLARVLNLVQQNGHKIILNTCREDRLRDIAVSFCKEILLFFPDLVNENCPDRIKEFGGDCRKISADLYLDDKGVGYSIDRAMIRLYALVGGPRLNESISSMGGMTYVGE